MIDGTGLTGVVTGVYGLLKVADVKDVSGGKTLGHRADLGITLVELVVEEDVLLPRLVVDDALVDVLSAGVVADGDDVGDVAGLVGDIVDGQRVFVVTVADISAVVAGIGATVDEALGVMDVAVAGSAAGAGDVGGIADVEEDQSAAAGEVVSHTNRRVTADGTASNGVVELLVDDDVVGTADGELVPMAGELGLSEVLWVRGVEVENLLHVEELDAVLDGLGANDGKITDDSDFSPV